LKNRKKLSNVFLAVLDRKKKVILLERILVTGATGFIGSHLVEALLEKGHKVYCLVRNQHGLRWLKGLPINLVIGNCLESNLELPEIDYVYHLAGIIKTKKIGLFYQVNYLGTINLVKAVLKQKLPLKSFVFVSTLAVNGQPTEKIITQKQLPSPQTHYAKSKWLAEEALIKHKDSLPILIFRPTAVYGPRDKEFLGYFRLMKGGFAPILNSEGIFSFCYVLDVVEALMAVLERDVPSGEIFFVSDGNAYRWQEVIDIIASILDKRPFVFKVPKTVTYLLAVAAEFYNRLAKEPLIFSCDKLKEVFQKNWFCDISKTQALLGYKARYDLTKGIALTLKWYQECGWL
jgi:nucleoside-diphosphate-sugar epimerase